MKIKTNELKGVQLDWAVSKCEGFLCDYEDRDALVSYSTDWSESGPIIEREGIHLTTRAGMYKQTGEWSAQHGWAGDVGFHGPTPLIAAMRCYVANKLGSEIEIPEEFSLNLN